jgi:hypothetical protein
VHNEDVPRYARSGSGAFRLLDGIGDDIRMEFQGYSDTEEEQSTGDHDRRLYGDIALKDDANENQCQRGSYDDVYVLFSVLIHVYETFK